MATSYKGGPYTIKSGGVGVVDDYVFRTLPSGRWTKVYVRIREGKLEYEQDKQALEFILQMRHHKNRLCVPDAQQVIRQREKRPGIPSMSAYEYAYTTAPEFRAEQDNEHGPYLTGFNVTQDGLKTLRGVLLKLRSEERDGFIHYLGNDSQGYNKWDFVFTRITLSATELSLLLDLAGIIPDEIEPGSCTNCVHSITGKGPSCSVLCMDCKQPKMSNFTEKDQ